MEKRHSIAFLILVLVGAASSAAFAQTAPLPSVPVAQDEGAFNTILQEFYNITTGYQATIVAIAEKVFFGLAIFHVIWVGFKMTWQGFEFQKVVAEYMKMLLFLGFFLALIRFPQFANLIISSFIEAANNVTAGGTGATTNAFDGSGSVSPSGLMTVANSIVLRAISNISLFKVGAAVLIGISVILILLSFAMMVLRLIMAYVEAYIAISAGMILLAFGAMSFTSELAKKYIFYLISVGLKLFVLLIILGIAQEIMRSLLATWSFDNNQQILLVLTLSVVLMGLAMSIPSMISGIVSGSAGSGGGEMMGAIAGSAGAALAFTKLGGVGALKGGAAGAAGGAKSAIGGAMSVLNNKGGNGKK